jgi:hypothetical protein
MVVVLALNAPAGSSSGLQVLMAVVLRMFGHEIFDIVVMLKLDVLGLDVMGLEVLGLDVLGLGVLGLCMLGLCMLGLGVLRLGVLRLGVLRLLDRVVHCKGAAINFYRLQQSELGSLLGVVVAAGQAKCQVDADFFQILARLQSIVLCSFDEVLHGDSPAMVGDWLETASMHGNRISHAAAVAGVESLRKEIEFL